MALGSRLSELKIQTSLCQTTSFAHRCCAGGWGGPGQPSELGHTQHTSNLEQRKLSLLARCRARNSIARADHHRQHRVARACVPHRRHRPLKEAHNTPATTYGYVTGPPYDSVKIKSWFRLRHYKGRFMAVR